MASPCLPAAWKRIKVIFLLHPSSRPKTEHKELEPMVNLVLVFLKRLGTNCICMTWLGGADPDLTHSGSGSGAAMP